jgi:D-lyxose ketol-isomerase
MKRSEINDNIIWAMELLKKFCIRVPGFAYWTVDDWKRNRDSVGTIKKVMLGWDITDYGLNRFSEIGGVLFTVRNGDQKDSRTGVPYAEKYILFKDGQGLPTHFHFTKTEDIINRAGGVLGIKLYNSLPDREIDYKNDVVVYMDGVKKTVKPGEVIKIYPGDSVTLTPYIYHNFFAVKGEGELVCGEVSSVNDDNTDNCFYEKIPRFGDIEEDEAILHPLVTDYTNIL